MAAVGRAQTAAGRSIEITRSSMMKHPVVVIGVGEMDSVFGRGLLRLGHPGMGRSAPARLARALRHGDALGLELPVMRSIAASIRPE